MSSAEEQIARFRQIVTATENEISSLFNREGGFQMVYPSPESRRHTAYESIAKELGIPLCDFILRPKS